MYLAVNDFLAQRPTFTVPVALRAVTNDPFKTARRPFVVEPENENLPWLIGTLFRDHVWQ